MAMKRHAGRRDNLPGALLALFAAGLFGISTPLARSLLVPGTAPELVAGLLYSGSGTGLTVIHLAFHRELERHPLRRSDLPWLVCIILSSGIAGPVLLVEGLSHGASGTASALVNLEAIGTMAIAWWVSAGGHCIHIAGEICGGKE